MIPVSKPYLPDKKKLIEYVDGIYERSWLTNQGPLVKELTQRLQLYLGVTNLLLVNNGTSALQIAYRALGLLDIPPSQHVEAITTPFTFIATTSSLCSQGIRPIFADIDPHTWCLDPDKVVTAISSDTRAIVPVHVFGNACGVESFEVIARERGLRLIYDAAHAFGVDYEGQSLLNHGDASILSFHATKVFHSIEGGAIVFKHRRHYERAKRIVNFGINADATIVETGINAKMNEFQAAMGLCVLDEIDAILTQRKAIWEQYKVQLNQSLIRQKKYASCSENYSYFPVIFSSQGELENAKRLLEREHIYPRRYFYPSLDTLDHVASLDQQPISQGISKRILCLPLYPGLTSDEVSTICNVVNSSLLAVEKSPGRMTG